MSFNRDIPPAFEQRADLEERCNAAEHELALLKESALARPATELEARAVAAERELGVMCETLDRAATIDSATSRTFALFGSMKTPLSHHTTRPLFWLTFDGRPLSTEFDEASVAKELERIAARLREQLKEPNAALLWWKDLVALAVAVVEDCTKALSLAAERFDHLADEVAVDELNGPVREGEVSFPVRKLNDAQAYARFAAQEARQSADYRGGEKVGQFTPGTTPAEGSEG